MLIKLYTRLRVLCWSLMRNVYRGCNSNPNRTHAGLTLIEQSVYYNKHFFNRIFLDIQGPTILSLKHANNCINKYPGTRYRRWEGG